MKKHSNNYFEQICQVQIKNLISIVDETLGTDITSSKKRAFTTADLWNVQRNRKNFIQRRYSL